MFQVSNWRIEKHYTHTIIFGMRRLKKILYSFIQHTHLLLLVFVCWIFHTFSLPLFFWRMLLKIILILIRIFLASFIEENGTYFYSCYNKCCIFLLYSKIYTSHTTKHQTKEKKKRKECCLPQKIYTYLVFSVSWNKKRGLKV